MGNFFGRFKKTSPTEDLLKDAPSTNIQRKKVYTTIEDLMEYKLSMSAKKDQRIFEHSLKGLGLIAVGSSIYINVLIRRGLFVYEGFLYTSTGVSLITTVVNYFLQYGLVQRPIFQGNIDCATCAMLRGAGVQVVSAAFFPGAVALGAGVLTANHYNSTKVPTFYLPLSKEFREFWKKFKPTVRRPFLGVVALQAIIGAVVSYKELQIVRELRKTITPEEKLELWKEAYNILDINS